MGQRLFYAMVAAGIVWLISGCVFVVAVRGPGTISAWMICGTGVFALGLVLVGLPLVAMGNRVLRMNAGALMAAAGAGGVLVIELPSIAFRLLTAETHFAWSTPDFLWPSLAFAIAAPAAGIYRLLLRLGSER